MVPSKPKTTVQHARKLRSAMSKPEVLLWQLLRGNPQGLRFRRQHPIGAYVLDFYCPAAKLCIEIDGISHDMGDRPARDDRRDRWLAGQGIAVVRIPARNVLTHHADVAAQMIAMAHDRCATPPPPCGRSPSPS